jgi:hypothetical protein
MSHRTIYGAETCILNCSIIAHCIVIFHVTSLVNPLHVVGGEARNEASMKPRGRPQLGLQHFPCQDFVRIATGTRKCRVTKLVCGITSSYATSLLDVVVEGPAVNHHVSVEHAESSEY